MFTTAPDAVAAVQAQRELAAGRQHREGFRLQVDRHRVGSDACLECLAEGKEVGACSTHNRLGKIVLSVKPTLSQKKGPPRSGGKGLLSGPVDQDTLNEDGSLSHVQ